MAKKPITDEDKQLLERYKELKKKQTQLYIEKTKAEDKIRNYELKNKLLYFGHDEKGYLGEHGTWEPNPAQKHLIRKFTQGEYRGYSLTGANQIGKTTFEVCLALAILKGHWPWEDPKITGHHIWETYGWSPPIYIRWIGGGWEEHIQKNLIEQGLEELWPDLWPVQTKNNNMGVKYLWKDPKTGSQINFMSHNQKRSTFAGWKGQCIEENEKVHMLDGTWKPIKDIEVGDIVWSSNDKNFLKSDRKVTKKIDMGIQDTYELKLAGGMSVKCTKDHKIFTNKGWVEAQNLTWNHKIYCPLFNHKIKKTNSNPDNIWFAIGSWIGDGWANVKKRNVSIANKSELFLKLFKGSLPKDCKLKHRKKYDYAINPCDNNFYLKLKELNLNDKKAFNKFIPDEVFLLSQESKIRFIQGLYCTDGWVSKDSICYASTSKTLIYDLHKLLRSFNIYGTITHRKMKNPNWRDQWYLTITKSGSVLRFIDRISIPTKLKPIEKLFDKKILSLKSKQNSFGNYKNINSELMLLQKFRRKNQWFRFKSFNYVGKKRVYDIMVEGYRDRQTRLYKGKNVGNGYHNFICEGIMVSNCIIYDEPFPPEIWTENLRGLIAKNGIVFIGASLVEEDQIWIEDEILSMNKKVGETEFKFFDYHAEMKVNIGHGLTQKSVDEVASTFSDEERKVRIDGESAGTRARCLKLKDHHFLDKTILDIPPHFIVDISIDYHPNKPQHILLKATGPYDLKYFCHEIVSDIGEPAGPEWIGSKIVYVIKRYSLRVGKIIIDPLSKGDSNNTDTVFDKIYLYLYKYGYHLEVATKNKDDGIILWNELLNPRQGPPQLYVYNSCEIAVRQLKKWRRDEHGKPSKIDDDQCENGYRLVLLDTKYYEPDDDSDHDKPKYEVGRNDVTGY